MPSELISSLGHFLQASPTPFHAVSMMKEKLQANGFCSLEEGDAWDIKKGQGYYVSRNDSSLVAFKTGDEDICEKGINILGAHTDSPCLKVKPQPEVVKHGYGQLGLEVYGGALLNPWFDRDLSIAGRVNYLNKENEISSCLIDFKDPIAVIPSLAIHLDREANKNRSINPQTYLPSILLQLGAGESFDFKQVLLSHINEVKQVSDAMEVLSYELNLYDVQAPAVVGLNKDFFTSARLDNLISCYLGLEGLINSRSSKAAMLVCSDHEEVGSVSAAGANGPFLEATLDRLLEDENFAENKQRMISQSFMLSVDNAHGIHPNFSEKHDSNHGPILNKGPVIKINANQRYASNSETTAKFKQLAKAADVPLQNFVVRSDMACGSTIGPIVAGELGIKTIDIGIASFAMHSIRELIGLEDVSYLSKVIKSYFSEL